MRRELNDDIGLGTGTMERGREPRRKPERAEVRPLGVEELERRELMSVLAQTPEHPTWELQPDQAGGNTAFMNIGTRVLGENPAAFTLEARVVPKNTEGVQVVLTEAREGIFVWGIALDGGKFTGSVDRYGSHISSDTPVVPGQEYDVALVYEGGVLRMYVNGVLQRETLQTSVLPLAGGETLFAGGRPMVGGGGDLLVQGKIVEAGVFDHALTAEAVGRRSRGEKEPAPSVAAVDAALEHPEPVPIARWNAGQERVLEHVPLPEHPTALTLTAWVKLDSVDDPQVFANWGRAGVLDVGLFHHPDNGRLAFSVDGAGSRALADELTKAGQRYFVGARYSNGTVELFIDGKKQRATAQAEARPFPGSIVVGARPGDFSLPLKGQEEDVRVFSQSLTDEEMRRLYARGPQSTTALHAEVIDVVLEGRTSTEERVAQAGTVRALPLETVVPPKMQALAARSEELDARIQELKGRFMEPQQPENLEILRREYAALEEELAEWEREKENFAQEIEVLGRPNIQTQPVVFGATEESPQQMTLFPDVLGGELQIQAWNGGKLQSMRTTPSQGAKESPVSSLRVSGALAAFDFSGMYRKVTGFSLQIADQVQRTDFEESYRFAAERGLTYQERGPQAYAETPWFTGRDGSWYYLPGNNFLYLYRPGASSAVAPIDPYFRLHPEELGAKPEATITAQVYRGSKRIASVAPDAEGIVRFEDSEGISAVIVENSNSRQLLSYKISDMSLEGDTHAAPARQGGLSPMTNPLLGKRAYDFPVFHPETLSQLKDIASRSGITYWDSSHDFPPAGTTLAFQHQEGSYQRIDLRSLGGDGASIEKILYYNQDGAFELPKELSARYGTSTIVIAPGAPRHLALRTSGGGKVSLDPKETGALPEDVLPKEQADIWVDIQNVRGPSGHTNMVQDVQITDRPSVQSVMLSPGGTYGVTALIKNPGTLGTTVTVQVIAGNTAREERFQTEPITVSLASLQSKEFLTDVAIPLGDGQAFVNIIAMLPDGRSVSETDTGRSANARKEYTERDIGRLARANRRAAEAITLGGDQRIAGLFAHPTATVATLERQNIALEQLRRQIIAQGSPIARETVEVALAEASGRGEGRTLLAEAEAQREALELLSLGMREEMRVVRLASAGMFSGVVFGDASVNLGTPSVTLEEAIQWYDPNMPVPGGLAARHDSVMGRVVLGFAQKAWGANDAERIHIARQASQITGIPWGRFAGIARATTAPEFVERLATLVSQEGYGHVFESADVSTTPQVISVTTNGAEYTRGSVRVRFDVTMEGRRVDHAFAYTVVDGMQVTGTPVSAEVRGRMFVDIPVAAIAGQTKRDGPVQLKVAVWFTDGTTAGGMSDPVTVAWDGTGDHVAGTGCDVLVGQDAMVGGVCDGEDGITRLPISTESTAPEGSRAIIQYIIEHAVQSFHLQQRNGEWRGDTHGTGLKQCKPWLQEVIGNATGVWLPQNDDADSGRWVETNLETTGITMVGRIGGGMTFEEAMREYGVKAGDIVQMAGTFGLHTMVITKVDADGVWVLDTNFGHEDEDWKIATGGIAATHMVDPNDPNAYVNQKQAEERGIAFVGTHYYQNDNTIRLHKLFFSEYLNSKVTAGTIYRVTADKNGN